MIDNEEISTNPDDNASSEQAAQPDQLQPTIATNTNFIKSAETPENKSSTGGVIILGSYLLLIIFFSIYLIGGLLMAETDPAKIKEKTNAKLGITPTATPVSTATPTPTPTATATVSPTPTPTVSPTPTPGNNGGAGTNTNKTPASSGGTAGNTNSSANLPIKSPSPAFEQNFVQVTIPKDVLVDIPYLITREMTADSYVFLVVLFSGMLGGAIRALYSFIAHLGLKNFAFNWTWFYISLPFSGAGLGLVLYFVIRGGFYGATFGNGLVLNLFSFAALGALTGLFTDNAMEKLKQVAQILLAEVPPKVENARQIVEQKAANKQNR